MIDVDLRPTSGEIAFAIVRKWFAGLHLDGCARRLTRVRFVRFTADERAETTLGMLAECFEVLGGVPGKVLADRMGCLKGRVVANVVVPAPVYLRFAGHYGSGRTSARRATRRARGSWRTSSATPSGT